MDRYPYVAIEGAIGVGKTTLARILGETLPAEVLLEVFEQNPFLTDFYADRERYAFQTQLFFLLSRYRQQHSVIAATVRRSPLVSDYLFAKDWLFAHLNLGGDELAMYERVHAILGEQIPAPDLVIYLRASTDALMQRIALRDRPYERQMDREYIHALRLAYEQFFGSYSAAPVLVVETENLDFVRDPEARSTVISQIKGTLQAATYQQPLLPEMESTLAQPTLLTSGHRLADLQRAFTSLPAASALPAGIYFDYISLAARIGALGQTLAGAWQEQDRLVPQLGNQREAQEKAVAAVGPELEGALASALDYLLQLASAAHVDLESAYLLQKGRS